MGLGFRSMGVWLALMVVSLLPLTNRLDGRATCAGSHATAVTAFLWPAIHSLILLSNP